MVLCPDGQEAPKRPRFLYSEGNGAVEMESRRKDGSIINVGVDTGKEWSTPNIFDIKK